MPALAAPAAARDWHPPVHDAVVYAHGRAGQVRFAVRTEHRLWGLHSTATVRSASLLKAILLVAYLNRPEVRDRALTKTDFRLIGPMIRRSDDAAAVRVLRLVGPRGVYAVARHAHMRRFSLAPVVHWGHSRIDAEDQARFFLHIDARVAPRHRATALHLLSSIVPAQRWGIGQVRVPGWRVYFKGGWSTGTGAVDHQVALLRRGNMRVAVAVLTTHSPSHAYAKETLRGVFERLLRGLCATCTSASQISRRERSFATKPSTPESASAAP